MINTQKKGLHRNTIDKYYTKDVVVDKCINVMKAHIEIKKDDLIIEPSAGNGSFIKAIKSFGCKTIFYDVEPENIEIVKQDYLLGNYNQYMSDTSSIHVVGNPPFGRQSSLAIKFIKKSCEFANSISFILPKSFKKDSLKKTFPLEFHLIYEIDIPDRSFLVNGEEHNVPCIFQIWEKKTFNRNCILKLHPIYYKFVKKNENPDISVTRVGINAGTIDINFEKKNIQTHYFIKFTNSLSVINNISILSNITYPCNNTVGPRSISKQELIEKFNMCYDDLFPNNTIF
jgi:predicted RNA methylase